MWRQKSCLVLKQFSHILKLNSIICKSISTTTFDPGAAHIESSSNNNSSKSNNTFLRCQLEATALKSRTLVRVTGPDSRTFLQGLITNDIGHLDTRPAIYSLFLNHQGRVLYDALLYALPAENEEEPTLLIECDASLQDKFIHHLKLFRVKKKVLIDKVEDKRLWVVYDPGHKYALTSLSNDPTAVASKFNLSEKDQCCEPLARQSGSKRQELPIISSPHFGDPRLPELGWRVLFDTGSAGEGLAGKGVKVVDSEEGYRELRCSLGVGEGAKELPTGNSFPLESNGDFLHGVSFQKGCYVGQELTARTYHTGVIRKRLMPFLIPEGVKLSLEDAPEGLQILSEKNRPVGKVRGISSSFGIALVRIEEALGASELKIGEVSVQIHKPSWWPIEASKELTSGRKS